MYSGKNSIFDAMKSYARIVFPTDVKWNHTSDKTANILLNIMMGFPYKPGFTLRIFNKFMACDLLYKHLQHKNISIEEALKLRENDLHIYNVCGRKALPPHIE